MPCSDKELTMDARRKTSIGKRLLGKGRRSASSAMNFERRSVLQNLAGPTGLEPATSGVTGRRSNRLNYDPAIRNLANLTSVSGIPERRASYGRRCGVSRNRTGRAVSRARRREVVVQVAVVVMCGSEEEISWAGGWSAGV